jgi:hypothetical protein
MGYSHRLYLIEKNVLDDISKMTLEEFYAWAKERNIGEHYDDDDTYVPLYHLGQEFYDFGKYYDAAKTLQETGKPLFENEGLSRRYHEYEPFIVGPEAVKSAVEFYRLQIVSYYDEMIGWSDADRENDIEERTREEVLTNHVKSLRNEWARGIAYNIKETQPEITHSWKYEYAIFELVRKYKTADFEKYGLLFMGW